MTNRDKELIKHMLDYFGCFNKEKCKRYDKLLKEWGC